MAYKAHCTVSKTNLSRTLRLATYFWLVTAIRLDLLRAFKLSSSTALVADVQSTSATCRPTFLCTLWPHVVVPRVLSRFGCRSFRVSGPTIWNDLPVDFRSTDITREQFKRSLKSWLFECAYGRRRVWETYISVGLWFPVFVINRDLSSSSYRCRDVAADIDSTTMSLTTPLLSSNGTFRISQNYQLKIDTSCYTFLRKLHDPSLSRFVTINSPHGRQTDNISWQ